MLHRNSTHFGSEDYLDFESWPRVGVEGWRGVVTSKMMAEW